MTLQGIWVIDFAALLLVLLVLNLVRRGRLGSGFGVLWLTAVVGAALLVTFESLLSFVTQSVGALFPVSALSLLAFVFIFIVLVHFSVKISTLSARQVELAQQIALREAQLREQETPEAG